MGGQNEVAYRYAEETFLQNCFTDYGKCESRVCGCSTTITPSILESHISAISAVVAAREAEMIIAHPERLAELSGEYARVYLKGLSTLMRYGKYAMIHWREKDVVLIRAAALKQAVNRGYFRPGDTYSCLISALETLGFSTLCLDYRT